MIEYLKVEITPICFADTNCKELRIKIKTSNNPDFEKRQICPQDDLVSFFDQIFDCTKSEILKALKEAKP